MKIQVFIACLLGCAWNAQSQISMGADVLGGHFAKIKQNEVPLTVDSTLSTFRLASAVNTGISGGYQRDSWEFTLGLGYQKYNWNQKFIAREDELAALLGPSVPFDSSRYLGKVAYTSQMFTLPLGVKYLIKYDSSSRFNLFLSFQVIPAFVFDRTANTHYYIEGSQGLETATSPEMKRTADAYFQSQANPFLLEGKTELGARFWSKNQRFSVDIALGFLKGASPLHKQMQAGGGYVGRLGCRYYFQGKMVEGIIK